MFKGSWKTTVLGVVGLLFAIFGFVARPLLDDDPATNPDWAGAGAAAAVALGLSKARDNDKSSEDVGAK